MPGGASWKVEEAVRQDRGRGEGKQQVIERQKRAEERAMLKQKAATLDTSGL
jgi:hypothetical protein